MPTEVIQSAPYNFTLPQFFLYAILAVAAVILVGLIAGAQRRRSQIWQQDAQGPAGTGNDDLAHQHRADQFAQDGKFVEAMHELLLQAISDIRAQAGQTLRPALTSREILRHAKLSAPSHESFYRMVMKVEWTYFGLRPATFDDYHLCRDHLFALRAALGAPAMALVS